jgi:hypothetical protein
MKLRKTPKEASSLTTRRKPKKKVKELRGIGELIKEATKIQRQAPETISREQLRKSSLLY